MKFKYFKLKIFNLLTKYFFKDEHIKIIKQHDKMFLNMLYGKLTQHHYKPFEKKFFDTETIFYEDF